MTGKIQRYKLREAREASAMPKHIAVVPCDGAGKEVVPEAVKVLRAAGADFEFEEFDVNADAYLRTGVPITDEAWKQLARPRTRSSSAPSATRASPTRTTSPASCSACASSSTCT